MDSNGKKLTRSATDPALIQKRKHSKVIIPGGSQTRTPRKVSVSSSVSSLSSSSSSSSSGLSVHESKGKGISQLFELIPISCRIKFTSRQRAVCTTISTCIILFAIVIFIIFSFHISIRVRVEQRRQLWIRPLLRAIISFSPPIF